MRRILLLFTTMLLFATRLTAQQASLIGTVLDESPEKPIADADVSIDVLKLTVRTDAAGNFTLSAIPPGSYRVSIRAVGRVQLNETVIFGANDRIERDFLLKRATNTLATVDVKADASPDVETVRLADFEERRKFGIGRFLTQDFLEKQDGRQLADVLGGKIPGLRGYNMGGAQRAMASSRGISSIVLKLSGDATDRARGATVQCYVQVVVDRQIRYRGTPGEALFDVNTIEPASIAGVEYYTMAQTPSQFSGTGATCGTLVIWTRMSLR